MSETIDRLFVVTGNRWDVLRTQTVGQAVAMTLGAAYSTRVIGSMVRAALAEMGAHLIVFSNRRLVWGLRPRHFDDADAARLAMELRKLKRPPRR